jgi:purine-binding chemotaxis protein CheW
MNPAHDAVSPSMMAGMDAMPLTTPSSSGVRWIRFRLAGQHYAVAIEHVREVLAAPLIEPVPGAPPGVLGVINLRGQIVTVLDLPRWLGQPAASAGLHLLVLERDDTWLALAVEAVLDVQRIEPAAIKPAPRTADSMQASLVAGLFSGSDGVLTLLQLERLLETTQV